MPAGESYKPEAFQQRTPSQMSMDKMWFGHDTVGNSFAAGNNPFKSESGARSGYGVQGVKRMEITPLANGNQGVKSNMPNPVQFQKPKNPFNAQGPGY